LVSLKAYQEVFTDYAGRCLLYDYQIFIIDKRPSTITAHHFVNIKDLAPINPTDNRLFLFVFKEQTG